MTLTKRRRPKPKTFRCAMYVSHYTEPGAVPPDDSTIQQRQAIQKLIASRKQQGWVCIPESYEDIGPFQGNRRPGLQRLLADVQAGKVDCVVIHLYDHLVDSHTNRDPIYAILRRHGVTLVSVRPEFFLIWGDRLEDGWLADPP